MHIIEKNKISKTYDLENRCDILGENVIDLIKNIKITIINKEIIEQMARSSYSVGANYAEANEGKKRILFTRLR